MNLRPNSKTRRKGAVLWYAVALIVLIAMVAVTASAQYQVRKPAGVAKTASIAVTNPAVTNWEKGKRYEIIWTSSGIVGSVKIDLVDTQGKVTSLVPQVMNSGKHSFTLMANVAEGDYKIKISSIDGKTFGESSGTVHIAKPGGAIQQMGATQPVAGAQQATFTPTGATGVIGTTDAGTVGTIAPSGELSDAGSAVGDVAELAEESGVTVVQAGTFTPLQVPESQWQRAEVDVDEGLGAMPNPNTLQQARQTQPNTPAEPPLEVTRPNAEDIWVAGNSVPIRWNSTDVDGPVKVDLVHAVSAQQYDFYPVTANTPNNGAFQYTVPSNLNCGWENFYLQVASLDESAKAFSPPIDVYTEPIDMTVYVQGGTGSDLDYYVVHAEKDEYLKFDVWVRNNGTAPSVTAPTVRLILIKEPEEIVCAQEEFGFGGMAPRLWYKTPDPRKFNIKHADMWRGTTVNLKNGAYRVEVEIDPLHLMAEDENLRADNRTVVRFVIR